MMVVRPVLARNEAHIDEFHSHVQVATTETVSAAVRHVRERSRQMKRSSINWIQGMKAGIAGAPTPTAASAAAAAAAGTPRAAAAATPSSASSVAAAGFSSKIPAVVAEEGDQLEKKVQ
jgi:type IV secretory pathway TrbL component